MSQDHSALLPVAFRGATLFLVEHNGQPYAPMRPIVEAMGLDWASQYVKVCSDRGRWGVVEITTPSGGGPQKALCLPLRKLPGWLMSIQPNKVRADLRDRIRAYQAECDDALWAYWTQRQGARGADPAVLPTPPSDPLADRAVRAAINRKARALSAAAFERNVEVLERWLREQPDLRDPDAAIERLRALELDHGQHVMVNMQTLQKITSITVGIKVFLNRQMEIIDQLEAETGRHWYIH